MPKTTIKVKSSNEYPVSYCVSGKLGDLSREQLEQLALRQLRMGARAFVLQKLNEEEPAIVVNLEMKKQMVETGLADETTATNFFKATGRPLAITSEFVIPITELMPSESGRGKKAADIFTLDEPEETSEVE